MKLNTDNRLMAPEDNMTVESLMKRGEQLHSTAIFEMCANLFKGTKSVKSSNFGVPKTMEPDWDCQR